MLGTLVWVGDTTANEFRGAVQYCLVNVSQLAFRRDVAEALARPATDVRWLMVAQSDRRCQDYRPLLERYRQAEAFLLRGPLCQSVGHAAGFESSDWHRWEEAFGRWFGNVAPDSPRCRTVAVVAATLATAEPLMELAQSCGATPIWCRKAESHQLRNVDAVWWDDSVASPASQSEWTARIDAFSTPGKQVRHAWIAHAPTYWSAQQARAAGVQWLLSKPHRIDALVEMLEQVAAERSALRARAA